MGVAEDVLRLAKGKNLATVATLMPDGQPQALLTWVDTDGEHLLVNTEPQRQKARNVRRDPRVTVLIYESGNPYHYVEIRGTATATREGANEHIDALAKKYLGVDRYPGYKPGEERIKFVIRPDHVRHVKQG